MINKSINNLFLILVTLAAFSSLGFSHNYEGFLYPHFYDWSCPHAQDIVKSIVAEAVAREARMAASLVRLHFHDCFVQGCDASVLLDSSESIKSEKEAGPNKNSARGFDVIDKIKSALEEECPETVSCADILTLAARDSTALAGGPYWEVALGRRDSRSASFSGANNNIPAPNSTFETIRSKFENQGLDIVDLVALSGSHTIGKARCVNFRQRLYDQTGNLEANQPLDQLYANTLRARCPISGGDDNLSPLDLQTPTEFDNSYFKNLLRFQGLLKSDQVLAATNEGAFELVKIYAESIELFFVQFVKSMIKMGNIKPLTGSKGEIRKNCRMINS